MRWRNSAAPVRQRDDQRRSGHHGFLQLLRSRQYLLPEYRAEKKLDGYRHCFGPLTTTAALIVSLVICYLNPVSDLWYYLGEVLILLAVLYNILDILRNYNHMACCQWRSRLWRNRCRELWFTAMCCLNPLRRMPTAQTALPGLIIGRASAQTAVPYF